MIGIINYGLGNLKSIENIIRHVGGLSKIINHPTDIGDCDQYILPGVGSFDEGMTGLNKKNWVGILEKKIVQEKVPLLGICLGMQLLCKTSQEGHLPGLGWLDASVKKFSFNYDSKLKIPHMGWNTVNITKKNNLIDNTILNPRFYFVHSYYVACENEEDVIGRCHYGHDFDAVVSKGNVYGVQFHPEKSHKFGMDLIRNFIDLKC